MSACTGTNVASNKGVLSLRSLFSFLYIHLSVLSQDTTEAENKNILEPVKSMMSGVAAAATFQPRYWKTNRPVSMSVIVA